MKRKSRRVITGHRALRKGGDQDLYLAGLAQYRPDGHLRHWHGRRHGAVGAGNCRTASRSIGHLVMINAFMMQLSIPLNFIGTLYREISTGLIDMEAMFKLLDEPAEVIDSPDAADLVVSGWGRQIQGCASFPTIPTATFSRASRSRFRPARPWLWSDLRAPVNRPCRGCCSVSMTSRAGRSRSMARIFATVSQASLRKAIGMVPQDTVLFNDTIAYNIGYGRLAPQRGDRGRRRSRPDRRLYRHPAEGL